jgi:hypothetical protein
MKRPRLVYRPPPDEGRERRHGAIWELVVKADGGRYRSLWDVYDAEDAITEKDERVLASILGTGPTLFDYLLSDKPLTQADRETIAWLLGRYFPERPRGRPRGIKTPRRPSPGPYREAEDRAADLVRDSSQTFRAAHNLKRLPPGKRHQLIAQAIGIAATQFGFDPANLKPHNVSNRLKRRKAQ